MDLNREEWIVEFKKRCNEARESHPEWSSDKVKMIISRDMPKVVNDGWE